MRATDPSQLGEYRCKKHGLDENPVVFKRSNGYIHRRCRTCYKAIQKPLNRKWWREKRRDARALVIAGYGGKCVCCGTDEPTFLTIDHLDYKEPGHKGARRAYGGGNSIYTWLLSHGMPKDDYVLACYNCNLGRVRNGGICAHKMRQPPVETG